MSFQIIFTVVILNILLQSGNSARDLKQNQLCGCPTTEYGSGYCERQKKGLHQTYALGRTSESKSAARKADAHR